MFSYWINMKKTLKATRYNTLDIWDFFPFFLSYIMERKDWKLCRSKTAPMMGYNWRKKKCIIKNMQMIIKEHLQYKRRKSLDRFSHGKKIWIKALKKKKQGRQKYYLQSWGPVNYRNVFLDFRSSLTQDKEFPSIPIQDMNQYIEWVLVFQSPF